MPDKKLTDREIAKAFECCYCDKPCRECPYYENFKCTLPKDDTEFLPKKMTEIINHLQCERNKYRQKVQNQREEINRLQAENERLKTEKDNLIKNYRECQVDNLKKFAERLNHIFWHEEDRVIRKVINNLLKELVGE